MRHGITILAKITAVSEVPFDSMSKMSRCETSGAHDSDYKATA